MKFTGAEILARVEDLGGSLNRTLERLSRMEQELEQIRTALGDQSSELQKVLSGDDSGHLGALSGGGAFLRQLSEIIENLSAGSSQEQILETLLEQTKAYLNRTILFREEEGVFRHWRSLGFESGFAEKLSTEDPENPIVRAARKGCIIYREESPEEAFPWLREAGSLPQASVCIPLVFGDQAPLVLYGDSTQPASLDTLELLTHLAVLVLKNQYLQSRFDSGEGPGVPTETESLTAAAGLAPAQPAAPEAASTEQEAPTPQETAAPPPPSVQPDQPNEIQPQDSSEAEEFSEPSKKPAPESEVISGELVEEDFLSQMSASEAAAQVRFEEPAEFSVLDEVAPPLTIEEVEEDVDKEAEAEDVVSTKEAPPATEEAGLSESALPREEAPPTSVEEALEDPIEAAPEEGDAAVLDEASAETSQAAADDSPEPMLLPAEPEAEGPPDPETERYHRQARRFARLLVTEIKLYNEDAVDAGRREGDLYQRLKRDIDRSREMYEKRAHPSVKSHTDHFHLELERILADGNPELLGEGYPGPRERDANR